MVKELLAKIVKDMKSTNLNRCLSLILAVMPLGLLAQQPANETPAGPARIKAMLIKEDGSAQGVWIVSATKSQIRVLEAENSPTIIDKRVTDFQSIYLLKPKELLEANSLYQARKYKEADEKFAVVKEKYKSIAQLDDNPSTVAAFYEMECARKLGDLDRLSTLSAKFVKDPLTKEYQLRQLELYVLWEAYRNKSWDRVLALADQLEKTKLPLDQRVQVNFCQAAAYQNTKKPQEALMMYQAVMVGDLGASEDLVRQAAQSSLKMLSEDEEVSQAMKQWKSKSENKTSRGYHKLQMAYGIASMYQLSLGAGQSLPVAYQTFLKFKKED